MIKQNTEEIKGIVRLLSAESGVRVAEADIDVVDTPEHGRQEYVAQVREESSTYRRLERMRKYLGKRV